jgi:hypothetical protein
LQEFADGPIPRERVMERAVWHNLVLVATTMAFPDNIAPVDELREDSVDRSLGNPDQGCDLAHTAFRVSRDAGQDMSVIRQEVPSHGLVGVSARTYIGNLIHENIVQ